MTNVVVIAEASQDTIEAVLAMFPPDGPPYPSTPSTNTAPAELRKTGRALRNVPSDDHDEWVFVGMALKATFAEAIARAEWDAWSRKSAKFSEKEQDKRWRSFKGRAGGKGIAYIYWLAKRYEPDWWREWRAADATDEQSGKGIRAAIACSTKIVANEAAAASGVSLRAGNDDEPLTDVTNARLLVDRRGDRLRHCASLSWLGWTGARWIRCSNDEQLQHAVEVIEALYAEAIANLKQAVSAVKDAKLSQESDEAIKALQRKVKRLLRIQKHAVASQQVSRLQAMLTIAASDPRITVDVTAFDADPWLLNCPNGTVDLRTGVLREHREADLLMHMAGAPYDPTSDCPLWKQTLAEVFAGEDSVEIINYVQRAAGYSATALTREEVFFLLHGGGRNGKGVIAETLQNALGSYARNAPMALFLEARNDGAKRFAIAEFHGVRMTVASEAAEGRAFDLATLKGWTGGDTRYAERKGRDPFEYRPTDKPWLLVNDKPKVKSWDVAFEERLHLVPFEHMFTGSLADKGRKSRLRDELNGILNWIVQGCLAWQKHGLMPPARCRAAVAEYRHESTRADEFIAERLIRVVGMTIAQSDVYAAYRDWSRHRDHPMVSERRLGGYLDAAGYERHKSRRGQIVTNATLRPDDSPPPSGDDGDDGDALPTQPPISKNEFPLRGRVETASPSSPSSPGAASSRPAEDDPPRTPADAGDQTAELTRLVGEMADDLDAAPSGTGPITGAALQTDYRDLARQSGIEAALVDALARHAAQVAGDVQPLPGTQGANCDCPGNGLPEQPSGPRADTGDRTGGQL